MTDHWQFVGYMFGGSTSSGLSEYATFNNRQGGNEEAWGVVEFDVWVNGILTLGNHTYICTSYYAPSSWYGNDPSTITLNMTN